MFCRNTNTSKSGGVCVMCYMLCLKFKEIQEQTLSFKTPACMVYHKEYISCAISTFHRKLFVVVFVGASDLHVITILSSVHTKLSFTWESNPSLQYQASKMMKLSTNR